MFVNKLVQIFFTYQMRRKKYKDKCIILTMKCESQVVQELSK